MRPSLVAEPVEPARPLDRRSDPERLPSRGGGRTRRRTLKGGLDVAALTVAGVAVAASGAPSAWTAIAMLFCLSILAMTGQYRVLAPSFGEDLRTAAATSAISSMAAGALAAIAGGALGGTDLLVLWFAAMSALIAVRALLAGLDAYRWLQGRGTRRTLIVGAGQVSRAAARRFVERPGLGLEPVGFLDLNPMEGDERDPLVLGASWDLDRVVDEHRVDSVLIGFSSAPHHVILRTVHRCWDLGLEVMVVPRLFEVQGLRSRTRHVGALPLVSLERSSHEGPSLSFKGAFDRVTALVILTVLSPLLAVLAILVRATSDGPVFHRGVRIGKDSRPFEMLKFRSMLGEPGVRGEFDAAWAAQSLQGVDGSRENVALLTPAATGDDPYTPIGKLMRRTALDELPQLWNVVKGEMALVGPRPERASFTPLFSTAIYRYEERHRVRPGMTGWAQVQGLRGETSLRDRVEWDNFYIENWSFWFDLKIMALTVVALLRA
ncbi:MAG: exopolysaccharide biosynthesis polyprenyl glycosylphosphotransferase [Chloroflexota bacterium]|nr:exopolysaccharide biosynthesis polyprenyl glycosylphosphotransferase [Chloroflexota bacterium]